MCDRRNVPALYAPATAAPPSSPAMPRSRTLRVYTTWADENKENIDPRWGSKNGGEDDDGMKKRGVQPTKTVSPLKERGTKTGLRLRETTGEDAPRPKGSPRSVADVVDVADSEPSTSAPGTKLERSFDIFDEAVVSDAPSSVRC